MSRYNEVKSKIQTEKFQVVFVLELRNIKMTHILLTSDKKNILSALATGY